MDDQQSTLAAWPSKSPWMRDAFWNDPDPQSVEGKRGLYFLVSSRSVNFESGTPLSIFRSVVIVAVLCFALRSSIVTFLERHMGPETLASSSSMGIFSRWAC